MPPTTEATPSDTKSKTKAKASSGGKLKLPLPPEGAAARGEGPPPPPSSHRKGGAASLRLAVNTVPSSADGGGGALSQRKGGVAKASKTAKGATSSRDSKGEGGGQVSSRKPKASKAKSSGSASHRPSAGSSPGPPSAALPGLAPASSAKATLLERFNDGAEGDDDATRHEYRVSRQSSDSSLTDGGDAQGLASELLSERSRASSHPIVSDRSYTGHMASVIEVNLDVGSESIAEAEEEGTEAGAAVSKIARPTLDLSQLSSNSTPAGPVPDFMHKQLEAAIAANDS